jgi:zinc/manganese transport system substrate-binding protein
VSIGKSTVADPERRRQGTPDRSASVGRALVPIGRVAAVAGLVTVVLALLSPVSPASAAPARRPLVKAVGAENQYADVIAQIGGPYVSVQAIERNPDVDPHTFEASAQVAQLVGAASLVVQNGLGYDTYMNRIESASPNPRRKVIVVQDLLGLPATTPNPHLWYLPAAMPKVASAVAADLSAILPAARAFFRTSLRRFDASLGPWRRDLRALRAADGGDRVAVTEPVGDYLLQAAGLRIATPFSLQADIMNGVDPAPEAVDLEDQLLSRHQVKVLVYNQQVVDPLTQSFLDLANKSRVPVVGVYETMPNGFHYQSWMVAETLALQRALSDHRSTVRL